jgi:hypothetical protein
VITSPIRRTLTTFAAATTIVVVSACGGSDGKAQAACDTWVAADTAFNDFLHSGQGDAASVNAAIDAAIEAADGDNADTVTALKAQVQPLLADPESEPSDELFGLYGDAIAWAGESCDGVETIDVKAMDYHFEGIPEELSTGYHVVNFENAGTEMHEMLTIRINDGVTESVEELVDLPEDEVESKITMVNAEFASPGGTDIGSWNLTEPGNYAVLCFVPVGSVGEAEGEGAPHFTQGMIHEFTVS